MFFYIKKDSTLPILRMELIDDARHTFLKFHEAIQSADIYFTMVNKETGLTKIANGKCYAKKRETEGCTEEYVICYDWKKRDTNEVGVYEGTFRIEFSDKIKNDEYDYPTGTLNMPIREDLTIIVR